MKNQTVICSDATNLTSSTRAYLKSDCSACKGICCVVLPFDADQGFGFDKPACVACSNLQADFRCRIHKTLQAQGFAGCSSYECFGAGQRVTQSLALPERWFESEELVAKVYHWFHKVKQVHQQMAQLTQSLDEFRDGV